MPDYFELDPELNAASSFLDRSKGIDKTSDFEKLIASIRGSGQQITIVVAHSHEDRFVCVCGHRRLHAARVLGVPVKALILGDHLEIDDLLRAQGLANVLRVPLSFIDKARFAANTASKDIK